MDTYLAIDRFDDNGAFVERYFIVHDENNIRNLVYYDGLYTQPAERYLVMPDGERLVVSHSHGFDDNITQLDLVGRHDETTGLVYMPSGFGDFYNPVLNRYVDNPVPSVNYRWFDHRDQPEMYSTFGELLLQVMILCSLILCWILFFIIVIMIRRGCLIL